MTKQKRNVGNFKSGLLLDALVILFVVMLAFSTSVVLKEYVFITTEVKGSSMEPTLHGTDGDHDRVYIMKTKNFKHGNIVMVKNPNPKLDSHGNIIDEEYLIKRVIALPGDELEFKIENGKGYVWLNGKKLDEDYIKEPGSTFFYSSEIDMAYNIPSEYKITIADGYVFIMGDNRLVSLDSRLLGAIKLSALTGKAVMGVRNSKWIKL